jgi:hypothetical protein
MNGIAMIPYPPDRREHGASAVPFGSTRTRRWSCSTSGARIIVDVTPEEAVIAVHGELDLANADALNDAIRNVRSLGPSRIVIDASELDFLAVHVAREIVTRDISVINAFGIVKRVLDLTASGEQR